MVGLEIKKRRGDREEDGKLRHYNMRSGAGNRGAAPEGACLNRDGRSCIERWNSFEDPGKNGGSIAAEEELEMIRLRSIYGNSCARMASETKARTAMIKYFPRQYGTDTNSTEGMGVVRAGNGGKHALVSSSAETNDKKMNEWIKKVAKLDELIEEREMMPPCWGDTG